MQLPNFYPKAVHSIEEIGLSRGPVLDLALKHVYTAGTTTLRQLVNDSKLDYHVVLSLFRHMQKEQLCDTKGMVGDDYEFTLTTRGRTTAEEAYKKNSYAGPVPVTLQQYCEATTAQAFRPAVTKDDLRVIFSDLVIEEGMLTDLGSAVMTGGVIFLYGPTGNGKTSIAERLPRMFKDLVYIPYAVDVSGHTIKVFDPVVHQVYKQQPENIDPRWVLCHRPSLTVGGELRAEMLEPQLDDVTRICVGPVQMRANNGILIIDDFGRQRMNPRELLNRWIVPLDRHVDHLSLWSGVTFEIPFELLVVMATNLQVSDLAEEAFIRRLKNKIKIATMSQESFVEVLRRVAKDRGLTCTKEMESYTLEQCAQHTPDGLRACFPRDILNILCGVAAFEQRPAAFDKQSMDRALNLYFVH